MLSNFKKMIFVVLFLLSASALHAQCDPAQGYCPLVSLPGVTDVNQGTNINEFIPGAIRLGVSIAAGLSVIFIMIGGIKYMTTDAWGGKNEAKSTIQNAIFGLLLVIGAYAILYTVNPDLVKFKLDIKGIDGSAAITPPDGIDPDRGTGETDDPEICSNCASIPSGVRVREPRNAGGACGGNGECVVFRELGIRLLQLTQELERRGIRFQVTEAFPPSFTHREACHANGTCVDANFTAPPIDVATFIETARAASIGLRAVYETTTLGERDSIISGSGGRLRGGTGGDVSAPRLPLCAGQTPTLSNGRYRDPSCCPTEAERTGSTNQTCSWITGNHFSVYMQ